MTYYPIFLNLRDKPVIVIGAGKVALRKVRSLVESEARVTVVAPESLPDFDALPVRLVRRKFRPVDLNGAALAFSATDDRQVNRRVALAAKRRGIPANIADAPDECDFLVPARLRSGDLQIAVSTSGRNPRLAAQLRRRLQALLDEADG